MSILDVTEDQIFQTLGKGKDPNFKLIEKARPVTIKPKKTYAINITAKSTTPKTMPVVKPVQPIIAPVQEAIITAPVTQADDPVKKLTLDLKELNDRVSSIQKMVKWGILLQFVVVFVLIFAFVIKS
jgi:hypothetical protein